MLDAFCLSNLCWFFTVAVWVTILFFQWALHEHRHSSASVSKTVSCCRPIVRVSFLWIFHRSKTAKTLSVADGTRIRRGISVYAWCASCYDYVLEIRNYTIKKARRSRVLCCLTVIGFYICPRSGHISSIHIWIPVSFQYHKSPASFRKISWCIAERFHHFLVSKIYEPKWYIL